MSKYDWHPNEDLIEIWQLVNNKWLYMKIDWLLCLPVGPIIVVKDYGWN